MSQLPEYVLGTRCCTSPSMYVIQAICIPLHIYIYLYMYICTRRITDVYEYTYMHASIDPHVYLHAHIRTYIRVYRHKHTCMNEKCN